MSGFTGSSRAAARLTQSAGVPSMLNAALTGTAKSTSSTAMVLNIVSFWDMALHWLVGAATHTSPSSAAMRARRTMPSAPIPSSLLIRMFKRLSIVPCLSGSTAYCTTPGTVFQCFCMTAVPQYIKLHGDA